ncbi:MAG: 2-oxoacid:ferredoxin oxidoreductase subunit alpha [Eubacteriales bacterium]
MAKVKDVPIVVSAVAGSLAEGSVAPSWREFQPRITDPEKVDPVVTLFCPDAAFTMVDDCPTIDLRICKGCGICAAESDGIEMVPEYTGPKGVFKAKEGK